MAIDLRFIVAAMKINNDLERIGDLAVNIARKAVSFIEETPMEIRFDIAGMWDKTQAMLRDSIDALVNMDGDLASDVCRRDDEVDQIKHCDPRGRGRNDPPRAGASPPADAALGRLAELGTHCRLRHEHCRRRNLHVRGSHHPAWEKKADFRG